MTAGDGADPRADIRARAGLTMAAEPGDPIMGALLAEHGAMAVWEALRDGSRSRLQPPPTVPAAAFTTRLRRWRARALAADPDSAFGRAARVGARILTPGLPEWPSQLESLGECRPYALWVRGACDLRHAALRSVGVVGSRAASAYGLHVAGEMGHALSSRGWAVVSGGAYGIDATAHRGALAGGAGTVVVLACGPDIDYPRGHENLFADVAAGGTLVTELPPGTLPTKRGFLVRNRIIAALTPGTVVVEAGRRSGAMNTAKHAYDLNRALMAVPGPVTSALSAGCHLLLRDWQAVCVTDAADVIEQVGAIGDDLRPEGQATVLPRENLDELSRRVLNAVPTGAGAGPATIATTAGCDVDTALRRLGLLAAGGFVERAAGGWRATRGGPGRAG